MRILLASTFLFLGGPAVHAQETKGDSEPKKGSVFDELNAKTPEMPDYSKLPKKKREEAERKWYEENIGFGISKNYMRFMDRLKKEAKLPPKDSKYVGIWGRDKKLELVLSSDGSFTWDYGHSKGIGIWREHSEGIIWIGFESTYKDKDGKEQKFYAEHFCYLSKDGSLVQDHIDYTATYKRQ